MAHRIYRLAPHQNAKVMGLLWAAFSLLFLLPMILIVALVNPQGPEGESFPVLLMLFLPLVYFAMTYVFVALACWLYNLLFSKRGGLEFELRDEASNDALERPR